MIYLASPYSDPDPAIRQRRFEQVCQATAILMMSDAFIFSPIAHSHALTQRGGLPVDWAFWERHSREFLRRCDKLWVLKLDGWDASVGVQAEIRWARAADKPISLFGVHEFDVSHEIRWVELVPNVRTGKINAIVLEAIVNETWTPETVAEAEAATPVEVKYTKIELPAKPAKPWTPPRPGELGYEAVGRG